MNHTYSRGGTMRKMTRRLFLPVLMTLMGLTLSNRAFAQSSGFSVEFGSTSGTHEFTSSESSLSVLNSKYDLKGSGLGLVYSQTSESGLIYGAGYHSYEASGEGSQSSGNITISFKTNRLKFSGPFALLGYDLRMTERLGFQPQLRLGIANTIEWSEDVIITESNTILGSTTLTVSFAKSESLTPILIVLPFSYEVSSFVFGAQYHINSEGYTTPGTSKYESKFTSSIALSAGVLF